MDKLEQPIAMKIAKISDETERIRTFRFEYSLVAKPGQFIMLWIPRKGMKPFGVSSLKKDYFEITVCCVGDFTSELFKKKVGDTIGIQGPYGKPFKIKYDIVILVAGGYGVAPLSFLADELANDGKKVTLIYGARKKADLAYRKRLKKYKEIIATDDGSAGKRGSVTEILEKHLAKNPEIQEIVTCGPEMMMKRVMDISDKFCLPCQLSLERYMKCGFGICGQCCVGDSGIRICQEGPVLTKQKVKKYVKKFGNLKKHI